MLTASGQDLGRRLGCGMTGSNSKARSAGQVLATPVLPRARAIIIGVLAAAYYISTQLSFALVSPQFGIAAFWPAAGVLAGGLAIVPRSDRLWLLAAVFAIVLIPNYLGGAPIMRALVFATANCLEGAVFVAFYQARKWEAQLRTPRDMGHFLVAGIVACVTAAAIGTVGLRFLANGDQNLTSGLFWVMADFVGIFAVTPVIFLLSMPPSSRRVSLEALIALAGGVGALTAVCLIPFPAPLMQLAPLGFAAPFILWCAIRGSIFAN